MVLLMSMMDGLLALLLLLGAQQLHVFVGGRFGVVEGLEITLHGQFTAGQKTAWAGAGIVVRGIAVAGCVAAGVVMVVSALAPRHWLREERLVHACWVASLLSLCALLLLLDFVLLLLLLSLLPFLPLLLLFPPPTAAFTASVALSLVFCGSSCFLRFRLFSCIRCFLQFGSWKSRGLSKPRELALCPVCARTAV